MTLMGLVSNFSGLLAARWFLGVGSQSLKQYETWLIVFYRLPKLDFSLVSEHYFRNRTYSEYN